MVLCLIPVSVTVVGTSACAHSTPTTITTPQARVAYQVEDLVDGIASVQHAVIQSSRAGQVPRPVALKVVRSTRAMLNTLSAAIDAGTGTRAVYADIVAALQQLARDPDLVRFQKELTVAQAVASTLAGGVQ